MNAIKPHATTKIDPRTRIIVVACFSSIAVLVPGVKSLALSCLICLLMQIAEGESLLSIFSGVVRILWVFPCMLIVHSLFGHGEPAWIQALIITLRMSLIVISATMLLKIRSCDLLRGLDQWRLPHEISFMVMLALRFLPMISEEVKDTLTALKLRGVELEKLGIMSKIRVLINLLMPLLATILINSRELATAIEMRGFRAKCQHTRLRLMRFAYYDYLLIASIVIYCIFLAYI